MTRLWPENTTILLVEDERLTLNLLTARFRMEGLTVKVAQNGLEALAHLEQAPVNLVVTDLMMPAMSGFRLIQEIRQLAPPTSRVPILVISSLQNEQEIVSCFSAGADDFMGKPLQIPLLMERLWRLLQRGHAPE
jgi:DNA-binding response OmpR family regulator